MRKKANKTARSLMIAAGCVAGLTAIGTPAVAAPIEYDFVSLFSSGTSLASFGVGSPTINNSGDIAYVRSINFNPALVKHDGTAETIIANGNFFGPATPAINDRGDIVVIENLPGAGFVNGIRRYNAGGTVDTLAKSTGDGTGDFVEFDPNPTINNNGQVAVSVRTNDNRTQIRRFGGASDPARFGTLIDTADSTKRFNFTRTDINDAGAVAFGAQQASGGVAVFSGTGGAVTNEGTTTGGITQVAINKSGLIAAASIDAVTAQGGTVTIVGNGIEDGSGGQYSGVNRIGLNNFGGVMFQATEVSSGSQGLFIGGDPVNDKVIKAGDNVLGAPVHEIRFTRGAINDFGQAAFLMDVGTTGPSGQLTSHIVRADPRGMRPDFALQPDRSPAPGTFEFDLNINNALGVAAPIYLDPVIAVGFEFSTTGANFVSVIVPGALPGGDDTFTIEFGGFSETLLAGVEFDLTAFIAGGVSTFTILGIDESELLDPSEPFVAGVTFVNGGFTGTVTMQAITVNTDGAVPEPASLALLALGLAGLGAVRRRRHAANQDSTPVENKSS